MTLPCKILLIIKERKLLCTACLVLLTAVILALFLNAHSSYNIDEERRYRTPFANSPLLPDLLESLSEQKHTPETADAIKETYDFVIVGSGAGGSTVAARLSEMPCVSVLVLEAGNSAPLLTEVPSISMSFWASDIDWNYTTESQKYAAFGHIGNKVRLTSGRAIGGGTVINSMFYVRGNKDDYNNWAKMGATGWSYEEVLPYFKKLEQNVDYRETDYHGATGPITAEKCRYNSPLKQAVSQAAEELGYPIMDSNGAEQLGFYDIQAATRNGQRCSAAKGYLVPAENRPNLDIVPNAFVKKIVIENGRATGVEFDYEGRHLVVKASKEVISSAGAVNSAKLLMLSGIGPKEHLQEMGIPVIADLPVGKNFHDHVCTISVYEVDQDIKVREPSDTQVIGEYIEKRTGPLSAPRLPHMAFLQNRGYSGDDRRPNHQIFIGEIYNGWKHPKVFKPEVHESVFAPYEKKNCFPCASQVAHPKSRGFVKLRSTDPYVPPIIDPMYLQDPDDVRDIVEGLKVCRAIINTKAMQKMGAKLNHNLPPDCEPLRHDEDAALGCYARSIVSSVYHPVGTAKMGRIDDPTTVVDSQLRVKGIERLRVVDASIMPNLVSGNTMVPTIMVAEKASDIIKASINC